MTSIKWPISKMCCCDSNSDFRRSEIIGNLLLTHVFFSKTSKLYNPVFNGIVFFILWYRIDHLWFVQWSAFITQSNIVRYDMNNYGNWGRISIRYWIHKGTPYLALTGELWGVFCKYLWEKWPRYNGTALHLSFHGSVFYRYGISYCQSAWSPKYLHRWGSPGRKPGTSALIYSGLLGVGAESSVGGGPIWGWFWVQCNHRRFE